MTPIAVSDGCKGEPLYRSPPDNIWSIHASPICLATGNLSKDRL